MAASLNLTVAERFHLRVYLHDNLTVVQLAVVIAVEVEVVVVVAAELRIAIVTEVAAVVQGPSLVSFQNNFLN
jgi:hypothetical protein